jgi:hypothetical protein
MCVAHYEYHAEQENMISFPSGAVINVYSKKPSGWWKGEFQGKEGYFPGSYVREKTSGTAKKKRMSAVRALYDFQGESETELTFHRGDVFQQADSPLVDGWARGTIQGQQGYFPSSFVEVVELSRGLSSANATSSGNIHAASHSEIEALRSMVLSLQQQVHTLQPGVDTRKKGEEGHIMRQLEESEFIRQKQQEQLRGMGTRIESLVIQVNKQNELLMKQQEVIQKLSQGIATGEIPSAAPTRGVSPSYSEPSYSTHSESTPGEIQGLRDHLNIEVRQRRDLESIVRKLETDQEVLSRSVSRLQRSFDEQSTVELSTKRLRRTGRDLTQ